LQAEDGIRDFHVTGVRRVLFRSIPVWANDHSTLYRAMLGKIGFANNIQIPSGIIFRTRSDTSSVIFSRHIYNDYSKRTGIRASRSEERRVGKEGRSEWEGADGQK